VKLRGFGVETIIYMFGVSSGKIEAISKKKTSLSSVVGGDERP
jgi:hypothetical protein